MKHCLKFSLCLGLSLGLNLSSRAALMEEGFNYTAGNLATPWSTGGANIQVATPGLTLSGLTDTSPSGNKIIVTGGGSRTQNRTFTASPITSGTVYFSFLIKCTTQPTGNNGTMEIAASGVNAISSADPYTVYVNTDGGSGWLLRAGNCSTFGSSSPLVLNTIYFAVVKYTFGANGNGGNGRVDLFVTNALSATEPATPEATSATATSTNALSLSGVVVKAQASATQGTFEIDTMRIGTTWVDVAPLTGVCNPASVTQQPADKTIFAGGATSFTCGGSGTSPTYQWQATNNVSGFTNIPGATSGTYSVSSVPLSDNGKKLRCVVSVSCGGGSTSNSTGATLTVNPLPSFLGVIVNDTWKDNNLLDPAAPIYSEMGVDSDTDGDIESSWISAGSTTNTLTSSVGNLIGTPDTAGGSRIWLTYFASNNVVVHLDPGTTLKATVVFSALGITNTSSGVLRWGLFNYTYAGGTRLATTTSSSGNANGDNVKGYFVDANFSTNFASAIDIANNTVNIRVRTNLLSSVLMSTTADYTAIGSTNADTNSIKGFVSGAVYTNVFSVSRDAGGSLVTIESRFTGTNGFNIDCVTTDTLGTNNMDFDAYAIRSSASTNCATQFNFTQFKVEKVSSALSPIPLNAARDASNIVLSWTNPAFALYSGTVVTNITTAVGSGSPYTNPITGTQKYFRLKAP